MKTLVPMCRQRLKRCTKVCPIGAYEARNAPTLEPISVAVSRVLQRLHALPQPPDPALTIRERNRIIIARFEAGEAQADLARAFGISYQRVHQIIRGRHH